MLGSSCSVAYRLVGRFGGMKIYETMRRRQPRFFIESGDSVYADGSIKAEVIAESGQIWTNRVTPAVGKVAESLAEFRGRYKYNLPDEHIRRFNAEVPLLAARATQTFREYAPLRPHDAEESERIYRKIAYGPLLDVFVLDMRSYRGPNTANLQAGESRETAFLGEAQLAWLQRELQASACCSLSSINISTISSGWRRTCITPPRIITTPNKRPAPIYPLFGNSFPAR